MIAGQLINQTIPEIKPSDNVQRALDLMEEFKVYHLPLVDGEKYLGLLSESMLLEIDDWSVPLSNLTTHHKNTFCSAKIHFLDVVRLYMNNDFDIITVLDEEVYLGVIHYKDLFDAFIKSGSYNNPGGILILGIKLRDFSLFELARIIETNDSKILAVYVDNKKDNDSLEVTLKLNSKDLSQVISALTRQKFTIIEKYHEGSAINPERERLDQLFKYLDI